MIAHEAFWYLMPLVVITAILQYNFPLFALPLWLVVFAVMYLFRTPEQVLSSDPLGLVCPVDSTVQSISKAMDPYLNRESIRIDFEMNLTDPYTLLSITEGKIMNFWMRRPDSNNQDRIRAIWIQTDEEDDAVMEVHPSRSGQVICYSAAGERVGQGKKCGFLPFGAKVVVYLPNECRVEVTEGQRVCAGKDIIARWPRS